jgi:hypothetical protein
MPPSHERYPSANLVGLTGLQLLAVGVPVILIPIDG